MKKELSTQPKRSSPRKSKNRLIKFFHKILTSYSLITFTVLVSTGTILFFKPSVTGALSGNEKPKRLNTLLAESQYQLKQEALASISADCFSGYSYSADSSLRRKTLLARLIHKFTSDFYGRNYGLSIEDEKRLFAFISYHDFNFSDPCAINNPFVEDTLSIERYVSKKINGYEAHTPYFNPKIYELNQTRDIYQQEMIRELQKPLDDSSLKVLQKNLPSQTGSVDSILTQAVTILSENTHLLGTLRYYKRIISEIDLELNIRLAIIYYGIGKDYGIQSDRDFFGWFRGAQNGISLIKRSWVPPSIKSRHKKLRAEYKDYKIHLKNANIFYQNIDLDEWHLRLYPPLPRSLSVKEVGLFGARRKHESGRIYKHKGVDLMAEDGTPVNPVQDGFVIFVGKQINGWGNHIQIWHDSNLISTYSHLKSDRFFHDIYFKFDQEGPFAVTRDMRIASVGKTGNIPKNDVQYGYSHLHLEIIKSKHYINPFVLIQEHFKVYTE